MTTYEGYVSERQTGGEGLVSYPLSKFTRVETSAFRAPFVQETRTA